LASRNEIALVSLNGSTAWIKLDRETWVEQDWDSLS
jgi:hypothetical protein